jgi:hypothetical protein
MRMGASTWQWIVFLTNGFYHDNLVFGIAPDSPRSKLGHHHTGHWKDRLADMQQDVAYLEELVKKHGGKDQPFRTLPGELPQAHKLQVEHTPPTSTTPTVDLRISARVVSSEPPKQVVLHYRPLDQTADWRQTTMQASAGEQFAAVIPGREIAARFDLQYYLEVLAYDGGGQLWPSWTEGQPYIVVRVKR